MNDSGSQKRIPPWIKDKRRGKEVHITSFLFVNSNWWLAAVDYGILAHVKIDSPSSFRVSLAHSGCNRLIDLSWIIYHFQFFASSCNFRSKWDSRRVKTGLSLSWNWEEWPSATIILAEFQISDWRRPEEKVGRYVIIVFLGNRIIQCTNTKGVGLIGLIIVSDRIPVEQKQW